MPDGGDTIPLKLPLSSEKVSKFFLQRRYITNIYLSVIWFPQIQRLVVGKCSLILKISSKLVVIFLSFSRFWDS